MRENTSSHYGIVRHLESDEEPASGEIGTVVVTVGV